MRKNKGKKYAFGVMAAWCLAVGAAALTGCGTKEVHNKITVESSVEETAAEAIEIETEAPQTEAPETEAPDPDEQEPRVEKDGKIRSYLTGEMVPVSQGNRRASLALNAIDVINEFQIWLCKGTLSVMRVDGIKLSGKIHIVGSAAAYRTDPA